MALEKRFYNKSVADLVRNRDNLDDYRITPNGIVRLSDPIFTRDLSPWGGAPFMAGQKRLGPFLVSTFAFNLGVLWLMTLVFYAGLFWNVPERALAKADVLLKGLFRS
jgi:hypothetical protein